MANSFQPVAESEFNSGLAIIYQLDAIEKALIEATVTQDIEMHYRFLVAYFKTLVNQIKDKDEEVQIKNWDIVRKAYFQYKENQRKGKKGIPVSLIETFDWWEIQLRNVKQKYGLGMPKKNERYSGAR